MEESSLILDLRFPKSCDFGYKNSSRGEFIG